MEPTEATESTPPAVAALPFTDRVRERLVLVQTRVVADAARARAQVITLPSQLRKLTATTPAELAKIAGDAAERVRDRVLDALDLPSRSEIARLVDRIESVERRIATLGGEAPRELSETATPAPSGDAAETDDHGTRKKNKRSNSAAKIARR